MAFGFLVSDAEEPDALSLQAAAASNPNAMTVSR
jgi:hypothetical protein